MATKKKGCGFLITALILLVVAGGIFGLGIFSAVKSFAPITTFETPNAGSMTSDEDGAVSVWLHGNDTTVPTGVIVNAKDVTTGKLVTTATSSINTNMEVNGDRRVLLGTFNSQKGKEYQVNVTGVSSGRKISLSNTSAAAAVGSIGLAIIGPIICGFLALIFGIIGLVKFFGSKNSVPPAPAQAPPAA